MKEPPEGRCRDIRISGRWTPRREKNQGLVQITLPIQDRGLHSSAEKGFVIAAFSDFCVNPSFLFPNGNVYFLPLYIMCVLEEKAKSFVFFLEP